MACRGRLKVASVVLSALACSQSPGSGSDAGAPDGALPDAGASDSGVLDSGTDAGMDAGSDAGPGGLNLDGGTVACPDGGACVWVNLLAPGRAVPATLFGDQIPNLNSGNWLWDTPPNATCGGLDGGAARLDLMSLVSQLGISLLRYPGGTPGDFFQWKQAVGPMDLRTPQIDPFQSSPPSLVLYCPTFGPDEFGQVAQQLGTEILVSANVGSGTAQDAADWLRHYKDAGVTARYWEIGNENYIPGYLPDGGPYFFSGAYKSPADYTTVFNAYATALRAVDPTVRVGAVLTDQTGWNSVVVAGAQQPDFYSVHVGYAPEACLVDGGVSPDDAWRSTLSANLLVRARLDVIEQQIAQYAPGAVDSGLAMTEHAAWWTTCSSDTATAEAQLEPNYTLSSGLYSATLYNLMIADSHMVIANHINVISPLWQAAIRTSLTDGYSNPVVSPFFYVFQLYAQSARGKYVPTQVSGSPTYDALVSFGQVPPLAGVPSLDVVAVEAPTGDRLWVYVVNRHLTAAATAAVAINGLSARSIGVEVLDGATYDASNSAATPNAVAIVTSSVPATNPFNFTFPAHSLTRLTVR